MLEQKPTKTQVEYVVINQDRHGQRVDNFLLSRLKNIPKSLLYRLIRKGSVRVNKKRIKPDYRLQSGDSIRIPPLMRSEVIPKVPPSQQFCELLSQRMLYEDDNLLVLNKPAGLAVHGGSGIQCSVMDALQAMYPIIDDLRLVHRLDRETSGCLMIAKDRETLLALQDLLKSRKIKKLYWALTKGHWAEEKQIVETYLDKIRPISQQRSVTVGDTGKLSVTEFKTLKQFDGCSLVEAVLQTGRMHQIRVHAQFMAHPIAGDQQYGDRAFNRFMRTKGLRRLFLHARMLEFRLPSSQQLIRISAPLDETLKQVLMRI